MANEIEKVNEIEISPQKTILRGQEMAEALKSIIANKKGGLVIRGERYLEFEDWQTLGRFFSYSVRTFEALPTEIDGVKGAKAKAEIIDNKTGLIIGSAEAYCLRDEENWKDKPFFQLASMAQTRAGSKALRNVLAWVAVLAGYKPTPAEEIVDAEKAEKPQVKDPEAPATEPQIKAIRVLIKSLGISEEEFKKSINHEHFHELTKQEASEIIDSLNKIKKERGA